MDLWSVASKLKDTVWKRFFSDSEVEFLKESVLCSGEVFDSFVSFRPDSTVSLLASTEPLAEDHPSTASKPVKRARQTKSGRGGGEGEALNDPESRYSMSFRLRVRRAVFDAFIDQNTPSFVAESEPDFMLSAPEEPLPVLRPVSAIDDAAFARFYTLEMDENDWARRDQIFAQYAASVRARLQQCDPSLTNPAAASKTAKSNPPPASATAAPSSPFDDLDSLPPLTDTRYSDSFDMPPAAASSVPAPAASAGSNLFFSLPPPPPLAVPGAPAPPPPSVMAASKVPPPPMQTVGFGASPAMPPVLQTIPSSMPHGSGSFDAGGEEVDTEALIAGQKARRKWIKMERIPGQVELYKALEKALKELKDLKAHSQPFLLKVRPQDAPDYYSIVTKPMYLSEVSRKLNLNLYYSKADFEADLNLIWANCRKYNTDPGSVFVEHANEMEKKQFRVMKRVPETDLTPYKEQILAENQSSLMSPAIPRMSVSNMNMDAAAAAASAAAGSASASAAAGASPQVLPTAPSVVVPQVPALKMSLGMSGVHIPQMSASFGSNASVAAVPAPAPSNMYTSVIGNPLLRRRALMDLSDRDLFLAIFDPAKNPETAIEGKLLPPEACYLPPFPPHLQSAITPNLQALVCTTLAYQAAPGPILMPVISLPDDARLYPDLQERTYAASTRALRLKRMLDRQAEGSVPFAARKPTAREGGENGFYYAMAHPEVMHAPLAQIIKRKEIAIGVTIGGVAPTSAPAAVAPPPPPPSASANAEDASPMYPRLFAPELLLGASLIPEAPFSAGTVMQLSTSGALVDTLAKPSPLPETVLLKEHERSADLNLDAIRTITRAKVTRDSLGMVMTGYAREAAEAKTPQQRGLLDEAQVQVTATQILSAEAQANRRACALHSHGAYEMYSAVLSQIAVLFLSRMGIDQASRPALHVLTDLLVSRFDAFAQLIKKERDGGSLRSSEEMFAEALSVFNCPDLSELIGWYDVNVVQYADQMLQSEKTLKEKLETIENDRIKRHEQLQEFLRQNALPGTELKKTHDAMLEAQKAMTDAQKTYYESKNANAQTMSAASAAYAKAQEQFRRFAKLIQEAAAKHELMKKAAESAPPPPPPPLAVPPPPMPVVAPAPQPPPPMAVAVAPPAFVTPGFFQATDDSKRRKTAE